MSDEVSEKKVAVKYCANPCLEGLTARHGHFVVVENGEEWPQSPPFTSKRVGNHIARHESVRLAGFQDKFAEMADSADLPDTSDSDEAVIVQLDAIEALYREMRDKFFDIFGISGENPVDPPADHTSSHFVYWFEHGRYAVVRRGCQSCGTSEASFFVDELLRAEKRDVSTVKQVSAFVDEVAARLKVADEDVAALRAKFHELFPESEDRKTPVTD